MSICSSNPTQLVENITNKAVGVFTPFGLHRLLLNNLSILGGVDSEAELFRIGGDIDSLLYLDSGKAYINYFGKKEGFVFSLNLFPPTDIFKYITDTNTFNYIYASPNISMNNDIENAGYLNSWFQLSAMGDRFILYYPPCNFTSGLLYLGDIYSSLNENDLMKTTFDTNGFFSKQNLYLNPLIPYEAYRQYIKFNNPYTETEGLFCKINDDYPDIKYVNSNITKISIQELSSTNNVLSIQVEGYIDIKNESFMRDKAFYSYALAISEVIPVEPMTNSSNYIVLPIMLMTFPLLHLSPSVNNRISFEIKQQITIGAN